VTFSGAQIAYDLYLSRAVDVGSAINLKIAELLGFELPSSAIVRSNEVIE
jgi:hypothetical protein